MTVSRTGTPDALPARSLAQSGLDEHQLDGLRKKALELRIASLKMLEQAQSGHPKASLDEMDILVTLYYDVMRHDPKNPAWTDRDIFILSNGHGAPGLYAVLADQGYFPRERLDMLRKPGGLSGHTLYGNVPGIEATTGPLGQGLACAVGEAFLAKQQRRPTMVYCGIGDGECQEGAVYEAAWFAHTHNLNNLVVILKANGLQNDGPVDAYDRFRREIPQRFAANGWKTYSVDGHDINVLSSVLRRARDTVAERDSPVLIEAVVTGAKEAYYLADAEGNLTTDKANAVPERSFTMEGNGKYHGALPAAQDLRRVIQHMELRLTEGRY